MKNLVVLLTLCAALSGCVFSHHSNLHQKGTEVSADRMMQIMPGTTDRDWVLSNIGTPDRIHADKDGVEVFEYVAKTTKHTDSDFILLFSSVCTTSPALGGGHSDYFVANAYQDAVAARAAGSAPRVVALNWGSWGDIGQSAGADSTVTIR